MKKHKKKSIKLYEPRGTNIHRLARLIGQKAPEQIKANSSQLEAFAKRVGICWKIDQIKRYILYINPKVDSVELDRLSNQIIRYRKRRSTVEVYKFITGISMLATYAFGGAADNSWRTKTWYIFKSYIAYKRELSKYSPPDLKLLEDETTDMSQLMRHNQQTAWQNFNDDVGRRLS